MESDRLSQATAAIASGRLDPAAMAQLVATASDGELGAVLDGEFRERVLDEVFARAADFMDASQAPHVDARIEWRIGGTRSPGTDAFLMVIGSGGCSVSRDGSDTPDITFELGGVDFLRLVTGNANPAILFLTGRLRLRGDELLALEVARLFSLPTGGGDAVQLDPTAVDADLIARVVRTVPDDQLRERLAGGLRVEVLDEVFRRFPDFLNASKTQGMTAVVKFKIGGRGDGDADRYVVVIEDGTCRAGSDLAGDPGVTIVVDAADFLKLVTGNLNPLTAFLRGRLKIKGDLALAARLPGLFAIPSAS